MTRKCLVGTALLLLACGCWACGSWAVADEPQKEGPQRGGPGRGDGPEALFKRLDANSDGAITKDEVGEGQRRLLERLLENADKNKDGKLDQEEFLAGMKDAPKRPEGRPGQPGGPDGRPQPNPEEFFKRLDANGDGKIVESEIPEERRDRFKEMSARADKDKDGAITLEEFKAAAPGGPRPGAGRPEAGRPGEGRPGDAPRQPGPGGFIPGGELFRALDKDGDGKLSSGEIEGAATALKKLDKNSDGDITRDEIMPQFPGRPGVGAAPGQGPGAEAIVRRMLQGDKNGDGKLSKEEAPERLAEHFDRVDTNSDGQLDETELKQAAAKFAERFGGEIKRRIEERKKPEPK